MNPSLIRLLAAGVLALAATAPASAIVHEGDAAPAFVVPSARAGTLDSSSLRGKPVYLNFFASWCAPCNDEAPVVKSLFAKYRKRGFVAVGIDELENAGTALGFARKYGWPFAIGVDADGKTLANYGGVGLPVHVFIDRRGRVSTFRLGQMEPNEIEDAIKKIL